tara:strand:- start:4237 stop:4611 length:375 start_codon:yes stop_codon:yes gene_type:complete
MAYRYARATVVVSKNFFNQYKNYPFGAHNVLIDKVSPNKFIFSTDIYDNEPQSIKRVTNAALAVYNRAHNDFMPCIDKIFIENVHISESFNEPEPIHLNNPVINSVNVKQSTLPIFDDPIRMFA